jgi:hypothetical protein
MTGSQSPLPYTLVHTRAADGLFLRFAARHHYAAAAAVVVTCLLLAELQA